MAPLTLHLKLSQMDTANNAFVFDPERSALAADFYSKEGLGVRATYLLSPGDEPLPPHGVAAQPDEESQIAEKVGDIRQGMPEESMTAISGGGEPIESGTTKGESELLIPNGL